MSFSRSEAKPFYGGTYFPARDWTNLLLQIADAYRQQKDQFGRICRKIHGAPCHFPKVRKIWPGGGMEAVCTLEELQSMYNHLAKGF